MKEIITICPFCGCGCGIKVSTDDKEIEKVEPSQSHLIGRGSLCIKGWHIVEVLDSETRLRKPLIKSDDTFKEVTWQEALSLVAEKIKSVKDKYNSIGIIGSSKTTNEENYLLNKLAHQVIKTNNIDTSFSLHYSPLLKRINEINFSVKIDDIQNSDLIIVIGTNLNVEAPQILRRVLKALDKGAKILVINSLKIPLANIAEIYIQTEPNKIAEAIKDGKVSSLYKRAKKPICIVGEDIFKGVNPDDSFNSIIDIFKDNVFPIINLNNALGAVAYGVTPYIEGEKEGMNLQEMIESAEKGNMECLYIIGEDILSSAGDYNRVKKALENVGFLIVQDLFMTETAKLADVILPVVSSLEKGGSFINMEGRLQDFEPSISTDETLKSDFEIFIELSEKLGVKLPYKNISEVRKEIEKSNLLKSKKISKVNISLENQNVDSDFPLWIKIDNPRMFFHSGSMLKNSYTLFREMEVGVVVVNPELAKKNNIRNNEKVKVVTKTGEITRNVSILNDIPQNIMVVTYGKDDISHSIIVPIGLKWTVGRLEKLS